MKMSITRLYQLPVSAKEKKQTIGEVQITDEKDVVLKSFHVLELPWLDNGKRISCIPAGKYWCKKRWSKKYGHHWIVVDVEDREYILIHIGNIYKHTLGCILPGLKLKDINNDGLEDVIHSGKAMNWMRKNMPDKFELEITWRP